MEYDSAIKMSEISPSAKTRMDLKATTLSEMSETQMPDYFTYMWNIKRDK